MEATVVAITNSASSNLKLASPRIPTLFESATATTAIITARAVMLLPLGNYLVIEIDDRNCADRGGNFFFSGGRGGCVGDLDNDDVGNSAGERQRELMRIHDRIELVDCQSEIGF